MAGLDDSVPPDLCSGAALAFDLVARRDLAVMSVAWTKTPIIVTDPRQFDNPIVLANQAFLDLTGYAADEIVGKNCRFLQGPDTNVGDLAALREAISQRDAHAEIELLNYRKDGTTFWNQLSISAVFNDNGDIIYYLGSQNDITIQRRAALLESSERRLLMEIDHRAMNALALVKSIVCLSRADSVSALSRSINGRIDTVARAHRLLSESRWTGVCLAQLLDDLIPGKQKAWFDISGQDIWLAPHIVQPISLVIYELIANADAHGALAIANGRISMAWHVERSCLALIWDEIAPGVDINQITEGIGLQLARNVVEQQLGGHMIITARDGALQARLNLGIVS